MTIYKAPVEDVGFLLNDVFAFDRYNNLPGFADAAPDVRDAIINEAARLSEEVLHPLNTVGDQQGCTRHDDGSVTTPKASRTPTSRSPKAAGWAFRRRRNSAARACRSR